MSAEVYALMSEVLHAANAILERMACKVGGVEAVNSTLHGEEMVASGFEERETVVSQLGCSWSPPARFMS